MKMIIVNKSLKLNKCSKPNTTCAAGRAPALCRYPVCQMSERARRMISMAALGPLGEGHFAPPVFKEEDWDPIWEVVDALVDNYIEMLEVKEAERDAMLAALKAEPEATEPTGPEADLCVTCKNPAYAHSCLRCGMPVHSTPFCCVDAFTRDGQQPTCNKCGGV